MSTRRRIFLAAVILIVLPVGLLAGFLHGRLAGATRTRICRDIHRELRRTLDRPDALAVQNRETLARLAEAAAEDNRLRLALVGGRDDLLPYLRDYAHRVALTTQLDVLMLMDENGQILSSAHHRNAFGSRAPHVLDGLAAPPVEPVRGWRSPELLSSVPVDEAPDTAGHVFAVLRAPRGPLLALIGRHDFTLGGRAFRWVGGQTVGGRLPRDPHSVIAAADTCLVTPELGTAFDPDDEESLRDWGRREQLLWEAKDVALIGADGRLAPALHVAHRPRAPLAGQLARLDQLVLFTLAAALGGAFLLAAWLAGRLTRPLADLTAGATRIDLDDPSADFATDRRDEVGKLARVLNAMVGRLRDDARRLADAEHRATLGEVARQVNHDLRNGITPVRNVLRHLGETAESDPQRLADVFDRRRGTLESSLGYLEDLAGRYARLAPERRRERCDLGRIARDAALGAPEATVTAAADAPPVLADPVAMRRILDNLVRNAREALAGPDGAITITVTAGDDPDLGPQCVLAVGDDGCGMTPEVRKRIFEDFYTTKAGGTGLGLSNVRRLAGDAGGRLNVDSAPGRGTTVTITFPAAEANA